MNDQKMIEAVDAAMTENDFGLDTPENFLKLLRTLGYVVVPVAYIAQVNEAIALDENGTDYEKIHIGGVLRNAQAMIGDPQ